jgi:hypothetical protein
MIDLLVGFGIASWMGAGGTYIVLLAFALVFPRLFRVLWWMFMLPVMTGGFLVFTAALVYFIGGSSGFSWTPAVLMAATGALLFCLKFDMKAPLG